MKADPTGVCAALSHLSPRRKGNPPPLLFPSQPLCHPTHAEDAPTLILLWEIWTSHRRDAPGEDVPHFLHPQLTTEGRFPPRLDGDTGSLARGHVALDAPTQDVGFRLGKAEVSDAGIQIQGWADGVEAGGEGAVGVREDAAVVGFLEDLLLFFRANGAVVFGTALLARHGGHFPCGTKSDGIGSRVAVGEEEIVLTFAIVVATKPTQAALVARRGRDRDVVVEVVAYDEAKGGLKVNALPVSVHLDLPLVQDGWEALEYGVHLGRRERNPR